MFKLKNNRSRKYIQAIRPFSRFFLVSKVKKEFSFNYEKKQKIQVALIQFKPVAHQKLLSGHKLKKFSPQFNY